MGVVATLLKAVPAAAKFKTKLLAMEAELADLRAENGRLREDLSQYIEQWETLDGPQLTVLHILPRTRTGRPQPVPRLQA